MNYPDSVRFLYSLGNEIKTAKFDLTRITAVLEALGRPHRGPRFVHVAGTNGKGSTCAMIEAGLRASGLHTGLFTSPHLVEPTERIRIGGRPVSAEQFSGAFGEVHAAAERLLANSHIDLHPTYFETVTAMGFVLFRDLKVDAAVLEVGMGGRLDATNVVQPELAVITRVDYDHEAYLGKTLEEIAGEKAGILKPGVPTVFSAQRPEAGAVLDARAAAMEIRVVKTAAAPVCDLSVDRFGSRFRTGDLEVTCPLAGEHQVENALCAVAALRQMGVADQAIRDGIAGVRWPGRLEHIPGNPEILLDGAHNPSGTRALAAYLERFYTAPKPVLIFGAMRDKSVEEIAGILFPCAARVIATAPQQERAVRPETIRELGMHEDVQVAPRLEDALAMLGKSETAVITGSLFLVAEAKKLLDATRF
jgi:dihydrofolate synthase / folylpolyglutamate synthase